MNGYATYEGEPAPRHAAGMASMETVTSNGVFVCMAGGAYVCSETCVQEVARPGESPAWSDLVKSIAQQHVAAPSPTTLYAPTDER